MDPGFISYVTLNKFPIYVPSFIHLCKGNSDNIFFWSVVRIKGIHLKYKGYYTAYGKCLVNACSSFHRGKNKFNELEGFKAVGERSHVTQAF